MKPIRKHLKTILIVVALVAASAPSQLFACAACFGKSDSTLAQGMNWGIFTLLGVVLTVLTCITLFFVHIVRREETPVDDPTPKTPTTPPEV